MIFDEDARGKFSNRLNEIYLRANRLSFGALDIVRYAIRRYNRVRGGEGAASIAFFTIFSLFPLLLILVAVGSYVLESEAVQEQILALMRVTFPVSPELIIENMEQVLAERSTIGIIGLIGLAWSATGVLTTLVSNIDRAWPVSRPRNFIQNRLVALGMVAGLGGLLAISSVANAISTLLQSFDIPLVQEPFWRILSELVTFLLVFIVFLGIFRWVPNTFVSWRAAFWAALFASAAWEITTTAFSWYLHSGLDQYRFIYGSLGTIVALMFWIYLNCLIILFGAHLSAAIVHHKDREEAEQENS